MNDSSQRWTEADTERFYTFLGRYIAFFRWIESKFDEMILLGAGHENWASMQLKLADMGYSKKIDECQRMVLAPYPFAKAKQDIEWIADFERVIDRSRKEGRRRNSIVHSHYLLDFVEAGMAPLKVDRRKKAGDVRFENEYFDHSLMDKIGSELAQLAFDLNFVHVQLVHWYEAERP
jgi:hypothetical protein